MPWVIEGMAFFSDALAAANGLLWGPGMLVVLAGTGLYLTLRLRFLQVRRFPAAVRRLLRKDAHCQGEAGITPFQALTTALSGTLGTGSVAGVATAVTLGGPGALVWMAVSALLGMATKYAEITLAVHFRRKDADGRYLGGAMVTLERGLHMPRMGKAYALLGLLASFGVGNIAQANTLASVVHSATGAPSLLVGMCAAALAGAVIMGGVSRIARVTARVVPVMAGLYLLACACALFLLRDRLPGAIGQILQASVGLPAAAGGAAGAGVRAAMRFGVSRGVFSNEAGMGSAAMAHASAQARHPADQGLWGLLEVAIDTLLVCMLSGLIVVAAAPAGNATGAALCALAFREALGPAGALVVSGALTTFAFATFLGWSHYGAQCLSYLGGRRLLPAYRLLFVLLIVAGASMSLELAWAVSDAFNALMILPNVVSLVLLSPLLVRLTAQRGIA